MPEWLDKLIYTVIGIIGGGFLLEYYKRYLQKDRDLLEKANIEIEGQKMKVEIKTNINQLIQHETQHLKEQIEELHETIIEITTDNTKVRERYSDRLVEVEKKLDVQFDRNKDLSKQLQEEMNYRNECIERLQTLEKKLNL